MPVSYKDRRDSQHLSVQLEPSVLHKDAKDIVKYFLSSGYQLFLNINLNWDNTSDQKNSDVDLV